MVNDMMLRQAVDDYRTFAGRCKELAEDEIKKDNTLRLVRGHYYCYGGPARQHWWCETPDGVVVDPSKGQFLSNVNGVYEEFDGIYICDQCGEEIAEEDIKQHGRYFLCSTKCMMRLVGL